MSVAPDPDHNPDLDLDPDRVHEVSFEQRTVEALRTLRITAIILAAALIATVLLAAAGFVDARNAASSAAYHAQRIEALGECQRSNQLRLELDAHGYRTWLRDRETAQYLSSRGLRTLGSYFADAALTERFFPLIDCRAAVSEPLEYHSPRSLPFARLPPRALRVLAGRRGAP
jgi:hypothetical protein